MLDPADPEPTPSLVDDTGPALGHRYRIISSLGSGATAEVFLARDEVLDRDVAVKLFRAPDLDGDATDAARRQLELQSLARLNHPYLVRLLDASIDPPGPAYLVLELVPGPDLASRLEAGPLPEPETRRVGAQVADALQYAHGLGIAHHDIKPANVLLGRDGPNGDLWTRLSDFGASRLAGAADVPIDRSYLAPEQASGGAAGPAADVYALGVVLLEALTGERYRPAAAREGETARPAVPAGLPVPWPELLEAMTATDPDHRPNAVKVAATLAVPATAAAAAAIEPGAGEAEPGEAGAGEPGAERALPGLSLVPAVGPRRSRRGGASLLALAGAACAALLSGGAVLLAGVTWGGQGEQAPAAPPHRPSIVATTHRPTHHPRATHGLAAPTVQPAAPVWHSVRRTGSAHARRSHSAAQMSARHSSSSRAPAPTHTAAASRSTPPASSAPPSPSVEPSPSGSPTPTPSDTSTPPDPTPSPNA